VRADDGTEVDDASALGSEPPDRLLDGENYSENVDVVVQMKGLFRNVGEGAEVEYPSVVNEDI
jgi:hypothetical protein